MRLGPDAPALLHLIRGPRAVIRMWVSEPGC
jgi:hypothetical protein